jgi:hypothetical protein
MKNYLSGSITKDPYYIEKFERFAKLVPDIVVSPIHFKPFLGIKIWLCYMIACLAEITKSDALYFIPDWKYSYRARIEYWFARLLGKPCYQINPMPVQKINTRIMDTETHWAEYHRNPLTGRYDLKGVASKYQKLC